MKIAELEARLAELSRLAHRIDHAHADERIPLIKELLSKAGGNRANQESVLGPYQTRIADLTAELDQERANSAALRDLAQIVLLPMAKGYAAEHQVGRNAEMISHAESVLATNPGEKMLAVVEAVGEMRAAHRFSAEHSDDPETVGEEVERWQNACSKAMEALDALDAATSAKNAQVHHKEPEHG